jgi:hypothetical protein
MISFPFYADKGTVIVELSMDWSITKEAFSTSFSKKPTQVLDTTWAFFSGASTTPKMVKHKKNYIFMVSVSRPK